MPPVAGSKVLTLYLPVRPQAVGAQGRVVSAEPAPQTAAALALNLQQHALWGAQQGKQVGRCAEIGGTADLAHLLLAHVKELADPLLCWCRLPAAWSCR
jgi:hypothetical protein